MSTILWICGRPGSGKTTLLDELEVCWPGLMTFDAEDVRQGLYPNMGYTDSERECNIRTLAELAGVAAHCRCDAAVAAVTPTEHLRDLARRRAKDYKFYIIHMECRARELWPGTTYEEPDRVWHRVQNVEPFNMVKEAHAIAKLLT